ncbi:MAG: hypothetical protein ACOCX4_05620, partial [Planctomycetota bacterium]
QKPAPRPAPTPAAPPAAHATPALPATDAAPEARATPAARPAELELDTTLTIRGRAPAGTTVHLAGRPVPVDEDGCFSLECGILDGRLDLPFEARREDAPETRRSVDVSLDIRRRTEHGAWDRVRILPPRKPRQD